MNHDTPISWTSETVDDSNHFGVPAEPRPVVMILSGPSGVGKDTALDALEQLGVRFHRVVTATTRPPRPNEVDGKDYHFVSLQHFADMIERDELIEYAIVYGEYKGVPKGELTGPLAAGEDVIMRVDVQGAETMRSRIPAAVSVFLTTATELEMLDRLRNRQSDSSEQIAMRVAHARRELAEISRFQYAVVNRHERIAETAQALWAILTATRLRTDYTRVEIA